MWGKVVKWKEGGRLIPHGASGTGRQWKESRGVRGFRREEQARPTQRWWPALLQEREGNKRSAFLEPALAHLAGFFTEMPSAFLILIHLWCSAAASTGVDGCFFVDGAVRATPAAERDRGTHLALGHVRVGFMVGVVCHSTTTAGGWFTATQRACIRGTTSATMSAVAGRRTVSRRSAAYGTAGRFGVLEVVCTAAPFP